MTDSSNDNMAAKDNEPSSASRQPTALRPGERKAGPNWLDLLERGGLILFLIAVIFCLASSNPRHFQRRRIGAASRRRSRFWP